MPPVSREFRGRRREEGEARRLRGIELRHDDLPGFWENYGYHNYGDPWKEQRYAGD
jgi:DMSO/TMAO reductase YedYZ molybdopterin-dependent catalytic subunit